MKLWIDTDPGVDDALALLMAFADPGVELIGLGIVGGNVGLAACTANALKLCELAGRPLLPVHPGAGRPLLPRRADDAAHWHGRDGFGDVGLRPATVRPAASHAALALIEASHRHAGELHLLTLGPLTNFALALGLDTGLAGRLAGWTCMGGAVGARGNTEFLTAEFNLAYDAEAAALCFAHGPPVTLVDWELVLRHGLALDEVERWLACDSVAASFYRAISRITRDRHRGEGGGRFTPADALAMTVLLEPGAVLESVSRPLAVETTGALARGQTVVDWTRRSGRPDNARIVTAVDDAAHRRRLRAALEQDPAQA